MEVLGWILVVGAVVLGWTALRRRSKAGGPAADRRWLVAGAAACLVLGGYMALSGRLALASRHDVDVSNPGRWTIGGPADAFRWEGSGDRWQRVDAKLV